MTSIENEGLIRMAVFAGVFLCMAIFEFTLPRKERTQPRITRWFTNLGLVVVDALVLRALFPVLAVGIAFWAQDKGFGVFNMAALPLWISIPASVALLDMAIYWQHVASHKIPALWIFHRVHHADRDLDVSSGLRFHPIEIVLSMLYKFAIIILLGAPAFGVFLFEILLNGCAMFNHSNFRLPVGLDKVLRKIIVTPDMHRVHHSIIRREHDTNYGFSLSIWDRLFRSYTEQPQGGHDGMTLGLADQQSDKPSNLIWCLLFPFKRGNGKKKKG